MTDRRTPGLLWAGLHRGPFTGRAPWGVRISEARGKAAVRFVVAHQRSGPWQRRAGVVRFGECQMNGGTGLA